MGENTQNKKIAIIIMASGYSERFGSNKLLESFLDKPLFTYTVDLETGKITPINYVAAVDCGTVINTNLARIQAEGGLVQGLGMTLYEDMQYTKAGKMKNRNFMSYKIPQSTAAT